jgi:hypothetical protein
MPLIIADRVRETTTTSGTGPITLAGPYLGFQAFSVIGNGNTTYYVIIDAPNLAWEVGIGTYASVGNTLARTTVLASSNAGSLVNLGAGPKDVILTQPARRSVLVQEGGSGLLAGTTAFTANGVPYANSSSTLTTGPNLVFDGANFGIGTSSPAAKLDVVGSLGRVQVNLNGDQIAYSFNGYNYLTATGAAATLQIQATGANGVIAFATNLAEPMRITSAGNVGIGATAPAAKFAVCAAGDNRKQFVVDVSADPVVKIGLPDWYSIGALAFINGAGGERMRIDSSGNVGIGTSSPGYKLDVKGSVRSSIGTGTGAGGAGYALYQFGTSATATENWHIGSEGDGSFRFYNQGIGAGLERMRLDAAGNVGIGTSSPGDKLEIGGAGAGIILASPNGTRYRITVSDLGVLTVVAV